MAPKPIIVIVGPTASGKSDLGIEMAKRFDGEIICADSRTVYKGLDIGTAKPSLSDRETIPHHLLDVVDPSESFNVADFKERASLAMKDIINRKKLPVMVGGSGLYIDAVLYNYSFAKEGALRDQNNPRHLSKDVQSSKDELRANTLMIGLKVDRNVLKQRIIDRIDKMVEAGLVKEVEWLLENHSESKAAKAPGYKAFSEYIKGNIAMHEAKQLFAKNDYQLAKRQMTWFRRNKSIQWVEQQRDAVDLATTFLYK